MSLKISPKHIVLDLYHNKYTIIQASQYNVDAQELIIHVASEGELFEVPQDYTASIEYKKADDTIGVVDCEILEDGTLSFVITEQMTAVAGYCHCKLMIISDTKAMSTAPFIINVRASVITGDEIQSTDEFTSLNRQIVKSRSAITTINNMQANFDSYIAETETKVDTFLEHAERAQAIANQVDSAVVTAKAKAEETSTNAKAAASSASAAKTSETNAKTSETNANASATAAKNSENLVKTYSDNAKASETAAKSSEATSKSYAEAAQASKESAQTSASTATTKANAASASATAASNSATTAATKAAEVTDYADQSKSYAVGTGDTYRAGDSTDNAKHYYEQTKSISEGLKGALLPMGTITFSQLKNQSKVAGYMYNISDEFTTDNTFKEGSGHTYPVGTNVYYTADGYWDCLAGTPVTGVKGNAETTYRKGNINITPANIGLGNVENKSSATIRGELTKSDVVNALGYEPPTEGATYDVATATEDGLMSATDKVNLDNLNSELPALKKSVAEGKSTLATTLSNNGVSTASDASFATINTNITTVANNRFKAGASSSRVGSATSDKVLEGYTFTNVDGVGLEGTMTDRTKDGIPAATDVGYNGKNSLVVVPAGYYDAISSNHEGQSLISVDRNQARNLANIVGVGYDAGQVAARQGTATPAQVLSGYTFTNSTASGFTGTIPVYEPRQNIVVGQDYNGTHGILHFSPGYYSIDNDKGAASILIDRERARSVADMLGVGYSVGYTDGQAEGTKVIPVIPSYNNIGMEGACEVFETIFSAHDKAFHIKDYLNVFLPMLFVVNYEYYYYGLITATVPINSATSGEIKSGWYYESPDSYCRIDYMEDYITVRIAIDSLFLQDVVSQVGHTMLDPTRGLFIFSNESMDLCSSNNTEILYSSYY